MLVVPAYYPRSGHWYVDEPRGLHIKARSLAALKAKLPADAVIEGYCPDGYASIESRNEMRQMQAMAAAGMIALDAERRSNEDHDRLKAELRAAGKIL